MKLENDLWSFALQLYAAEGVESACLELQQAGMSINRIIYAIWLGLEGRELDITATAAADRWQSEVTHPLRALRYRVRVEKQQSADYAECYGAMRKAELACEQQELALLHAAHTAMPLASPGAALVVENLARYRDNCTLEAGREIKPALRQVLVQALPEESELSVLADSGLDRF